MSETHASSPEPPLKEDLQRETKHEVRGELADLTAEMGASAMRNGFLRDKDYFGLPHASQAEKDTLNKVLEQVELTLMGARLEDMPDKIILDMLTQEIALLDQSQQETSFTTLFDQLKTQQISNREYLAHVIALADSKPTAVPQTYLTSYRQFQQLLSPKLVRNEQDRKVIEQKFMGLDMTTQPNPITFIQTEILGDSEQTGVSLKTQNQIRETFNIPTVNSGTEILHVLEAMNEDGSVVYDETHPLAIRPGVNAYINNSGNQILQTEIAGRPSRDFDITGWPAARVTELSEYLTLYTLSEQAGISNMLEACYDIDFALGDDFNISKQAQTRQVIEALLGRNKGYDGRIIDESDVAMLKWQLQIFSDRGDKAQGDHDIEATRQNLTELGVRDKDGQLNYDVLKAIGSYTSNIYMTGEPNYYNLKKHMTKTLKKIS